MLGQFFFAGRRPGAETGGGGTDCSTYRVEQGCLTGRPKSVDARPSYMNAL